MQPLRWVVRTLLLLAVVALAAGCAAPQESGRGAGDGAEQSPPVNVTPPGCIEEGQTGSGTGDIVADDVCPGAGGDSVNGTTAG